MSDPAAVPSGNADKPAAGSSGSAPIRTPRPASMRAEDEDASASLHRFFERNAGWGTIVTAVLLVLIIGVRAGTQDFLHLQWILGPVGLHLLFIIVLFTRPLNTDADINTIFRFAWSFVAAATIFGLLFLILGSKGISPSDPATPTLFGIVKLKTADSPPANGAAEPDSTSPRDSCPAVQETEARTPKAPCDGPDPHSVAEQRQATSPVWTPNLLAIVRGCDYNSVAYTNTRPAGTESTNRKTDKAASAANLETLLPPRDTPQAGMPVGVNCGELPPQWVIVIGGSILECDFDGTCPKQQPRPEPGRLEAAVARAEEDLKEALMRQQHADDASQAQALARAAGAGGPEALPRPASPRVTPGGRRDERERAQTTPSGAAAKPDDKVTSDRTPTVGESRAALRDAKSVLELEKSRGDYHLNIAGSPVVGGLVIPVFFVAIALMGALINMGRKLPEFQERVDPVYRKEFDEKLSINGDVQPPLNRPYARDLVVFQIIQVLSAPGIAVLAYSWARPEDQAVTVIVAFAAGFTSEVFLLAVRGVVDRVIGLGPRPPRIRAELATDARGSAGIPARGPAMPAATPRSAEGGLKVGDVVTLLQPLGPCMPGAQGRVLSVGPGDEVIVQTFQDHTGLPLSVRLPSQSASFFQSVGARRAPASGPGPVG